ncbi:helix-turn-helix domain-containing protein [Microbacterium sp. K2]|uniref:helix-turn-helix domain-containing protein n=1 Tax=Microbacterium sp. K2 TaxID=3391827 RepID=UPI003ED8CE78
MRLADLDAIRERCAVLVDLHYRDHRVGPTWLARELFVSRRQLDRAFVGCPSVAELLARRRLRQVVATASRDPDVPMFEIARRCGYGTYETFRAQCHRYLGCSPREARRGQGAISRAMSQRALADQQSLGLSA